MELSDPFNEATFNERLRPRRKQQRKTLNVNFYLPFAHTYL